MLLGEHCPETGEVPLMQQPKTGRKFSVAIDKFIDELHQPKPATSPAPALPPAQARLAAPQPPPAPAPLPSAQPPAQPLLTLPAVAGMASVDATLDAAVAEVAAKVQLYTEQLRGAGHFDAPRLISLLGECACTIRNLNLAKASAN